MNAEIQQHLDALTDRNIATGMSLKEARNAALREFAPFANSSSALQTKRHRAVTIYFFQELFWQQTDHLTRSENLQEQSRCRAKSF